MPAHLPARQSQLTASGCCSSHPVMVTVCTQPCTPSHAYLLLLGAHPSVYGAHPALLGAHLALLGAHPAVHTQLYWVHTWPCTPSCAHPRALPMPARCCSVHMLSPGAAHTAVSRTPVPNQFAHQLQGHISWGHRGGDSHHPRQHQQSGPGVPAPQIMPMHSCLSERGGLSILMEQRLGAPSRRMSTLAGRGGARGGRWAPQGSK